MNNRRASSPSHIYTDRASNYNSNTNNNTYNNSSYHNNRRNYNVSRNNNSILPPRSNTPGRTILAEHRSPMRGGYYQPPMHREQSLYYDDMPPPPSQAISRSQTPIGRPPSRAQSPIPMRSMGGMVPPSIPNYFSQPSYSNDTTGYYNPPPPPPPAAYRSSSPYHHSGPLQQPPHFIDIPRSQIQYHNQLREENEFLFASTLSEQDNLYGTNMTENLTIEDDRYIRHLLSTGFSEFDALKANFERKLNQPRNNSIRDNHHDSLADDEALEQAIQLSLTDANVRTSSLETVGVAYIQSYEIDEEEALRRSLSESLDTYTRAVGGGGRDRERAGRRGLISNQNSSAPPQLSSSSTIPIQQGIINPHTRTPPIVSTINQQSQSQRTRRIERNTTSTTYSSRNNNNNDNNNNVRSSSNIRGSQDRGSNNNNNIISSDSGLVNRNSDTIISEEEEAMNIAIRESLIDAGLIPSLPPSSNIILSPNRVSSPSPHGTNIRSSSPFYQQQHQLQQQQQQQELLSSGINIYHHQENNNNISPIRNSIPVYSPPTGIRPPMVVGGHGMNTMMLNSNYISPPYMSGSPYNYDASLTQVGGGGGRISPYHLQPSPTPPPFGAYSDPYLQQQQQQLALQQYNIQQQMIALQQFNPPLQTSSSSNHLQSSIQSTSTTTSTTQRQQQQLQQEQYQNHHHQQQQQSSRSQFPPSLSDDQMSVGSEESFSSIASVLKTLSPSIPAQAEIIEQLKNHHRDNKMNKQKRTTTTTTYKSNNNYNNNNNSSTHKSTHTSTFTSNNNTINHTKNNKSNQYPYNINNAKLTTNEISNPSIITNIAPEYNNNISSSAYNNNSNSNKYMKEQHDKYNNSTTTTSSNVIINNTKNNQGFPINTSYSNETRTGINNYNNNNNKNNNNFDPELYTNTLISGQINNNNNNNKYYNSTNIPQINSKYIDSSDEDDKDDDSDDDSGSNSKDDIDAYNSQGFSAPNSINSTITEDTTILKNKYNSSASSFVTTKTMTGPPITAVVINNDNVNNSKNSYNYNDNLSSAILELQNNNILDTSNSSYNTNSNSNNNYTNGNFNPDIQQIPPARKIVQSTQERAQAAKLKSSVSFLLERSASSSPVMGLNSSNLSTPFQQQQQQQQSQHQSSYPTSTSALSRVPSPTMNGIGSNISQRTISSNRAPSPVIGANNRAPSPVIGATNRAPSPVIGANNRATSPVGLKPPLSSTTTTTIAPLSKITNPPIASTNRPISPVIGLNANQNLPKKLSGNDDLFNADGQALSKSTTGTGTTTTASTKIQAGISNNDQLLKSNSSSTSSAILNQSQINQTTTSTTATAATTTSGVIQAQPKMFGMRAPSPSSSLVVGAVTGAKTFKMIPPINVKSKMVVPPTSTSAMRKNNFNLTNLNNKASSSASITSSLFSDSDSTIDPEKIAKRKAAVESLKSLLNSTED